MSFNASEVLVNGDGTAKFTLAMSTNFDAPQAMDFVITFPEGMTYEGYEKTDRWCDRTRMTINPRVNGPEGAYGVAIYNMSTNQSFTGTEGDFITFVVKGSDALAKVSEITVTKATVSTQASVAVPLNNLSIKVVNGKYAYDDAQAVIAGLEASLQQALAKIAEECPNVKDNFTGAEITEQINNFRAAVDAAYADGSLNANYAGVMAPADAIRTAIEKLQADAAAAQQKYLADQEAARKEANKAAYETDLAKIDALQKKYDAAVLDIRTNYSGCEDAAAEAAVKSAIDALKTAADAANAAVAKEGTYAPVATDAKVAEVEAAIAALVANAKAEAERIGANEAAYRSDLAKVDALQQKLAAAELEIRTNYKDYEDAAAEAAVKATIDALKKAVEEAYAAVGEGTYVSVVTEEKVAEIEGAIAALVANAKAEAERVAANEAAYKADLKTIDELIANLDETIVEIESGYRDYEDVRANAAVRKAINDAKALVESAYEAVKSEGNYVSPLTEKVVADLNAQIEALLEDAILKADIARRAANLEAYNNDVKTLNGLNELYTSIMEEIEAKYAEGLDKEEAEAIKTALQDMLKECEDEYAGTMDEGTYESPLAEFNADAFKLRMQKLLDNAKTNGIDLINLDENGNVKIYTLDGVQVAHPVKGQVNVFVTPEGVFKKFVK